MNFLESKMQICRHFGPSFAPVFPLVWNELWRRLRNMTSGLTHLACFTSVNLTLVVHTKCWKEAFCMDCEAVGCVIFLSKRSVLSLTNLFLSWKNMILRMCTKLGVNAGDRNVCQSMLHGKNTIFVNTSRIDYLPVAYWLSVRPVFRTSYNTRGCILVLSRSRKFFQVACVSEAPSTLGGRNLKAPFFRRISVDGRPNRISKTTFSSSSVSCFLYSSLLSLVVSWLPCANSKETLAVRELFVLTSYVPCTVPRTLL